MQPPLRHPRHSVPPQPEPLLGAAAPAGSLALPPLAPLQFITMAVAVAAGVTLPLEQALALAVRSVTVQAEGARYPAAAQELAARAGLRAAFAALAQRRITGGARVDPRHLTIASGCGALIQHLAFLLADAGDCALLVTPTYGALYNDTGVLAGVEVAVAGLWWL